MVVTEAEGRPRKEDIMGIMGHGAYIGDHKIFSRVMELNLRAAWEIITTSHIAMDGQRTSEDFVTYPGDERFLFNAGLNNKCWVVVEARWTGVVAVYNHDGTYYLYHCPPESSEKFLGIIARGARDYPRDTRLRDLVQSVSLALGVPDPLAA